jgi:hypothetical protein
VTCAGTVNRCELPVNANVTVWDRGIVLTDDRRTIGAMTALFGATKVRDFLAGSVVWVAFAFARVVTSDAAPRMIGIY